MRFIYVKFFLFIINLISRKASYCPRTDFETLFLYKYIKSVKSTVASKLKGAVFARVTSLLNLMAQPGSPELEHQKLKGKFASFPPVLASRKKKLASKKYSLRCTCGNGGGVLGKE